MKFIMRRSLSSLLSFSVLLPLCSYSDGMEAPSEVKAAAWSSAASTVEPEGLVEHVDAAGPEVELDFGSPVSESVLGAARGGAEQSVSENNLNALLEGNSASDLSTGNNSIADGAFSGSTGLPMVIQNSGNNVIIQNSTILNLDLH